MFRNWIRNVLNPEETVKTISDAIFNALKNSSGLIAIQKARSEVEKKLYKDILNQDIPFFTEKGGKVYYGDPTGGIPIAKVASTMPKKG